MQQSGAQSGSRALGVVAGLLTSVQFVGVSAAFLGLGYLVVIAAPLMADLAQGFWSTNGFWGFWAGVLLFFGAVLSVCALVILVGLGYLVALFGIAVVSILRGRGERLTFAGAINAFAAAQWATLFVVEAREERAEGMALFAALLVIALGAAACCFAARPRRANA